MEFDIDFKALLNMKIDGELLKNKEFAPLVRVCHKYGIHGMDVATFLMEFAVAAEQINGENNNG